MFIDMFIRYNSMIINKYIIVDYFYFVCFGVFYLFGCYSVLQNGNVLNVNISNWLLFKYENRQVE